MPPSTPVRAAILPATGALLLVVAALLAALPTRTGVTVEDGALDDGVVTVSEPVRMRPGAAIVLTAPETIDVGTRLRLQGDVVTRTGQRSRPRPVRLAERVAGTWTQIARTRSSRTGSFSFRIDAGPGAGVRTFRAEAPAAPGLTSVRSRTLRVGVQAGPASTPTSTPASTPTPAPVPAPATPGVGWETLAPGSIVAPEALPAGYAAAGAGTDWTYLFSGGGRWNPCTPIRWVYNPAQQEYAGAFADVVRSFARISGVSGLQFQYVGSTTAGYLGRTSDLDGLGSTADLVVSWATAAQYADLGSDVVGIGGGVASRASASADVRWRFVRGYLVLDADSGFAIPSGFDVSGWGQIMQHEILHALGLGHASGSQQLMYGEATPANVSFGAGDLTGMARIGSSSGCLS